MRGFERMREVEKGQDIQRDRELRLFRYGGIFNFYRIPRTLGMAVSGLFDILIFHMSSAYLMR